MILKQAAALGAILFLGTGSAMALEVGVRHTTGHQNIHLRNGEQSSSTVSKGHLTETSTRNGASIFAKDFSVDGHLTGTEGVQLDAGRDGFTADGLLDVSGYTNSRTFRGTMTERTSSSNDFSGDAGSRFSEVSSFAR